jgi:pimeloyl-ACP methyl ester carboxylesterase
MPALSRVTFSVALGAVLALTRVSAATPAPSEHPCFISGYAAEVRCLAIAVPRDWSHPAGAQIALGAVIVPALGGGRKHPPLLVIPGGPGQAGSDLGRIIDTAFARARDGRDIVLFDPRGTGRSTPLHCAFDVTLRPFDADALTRAGRACAAPAGDFGPVPALSAIASDVEALRRALGAPVLDIWGGSYGTKEAQAYAQIAPQHVGKLVLDGAVPLDISILAIAAPSADRAWDRLVTDCHADALCRAAFPNLAAETGALLKSAAAAPLRAQVADPLSGRVRGVTIDRTALANIIRGALYVPLFAASLPNAIHRAALGDLAPLLTLNASDAAWSTDTMQLGATAAVLCSEDAAMEARSSRAPGRLIGTSYADYWLALCRAWPARGPSFLPRRIARRDNEALILAGDLDPIVPPEVAQHVARFFPHATVLIAPAGGHTISTLGCVPDLIAQFLDGGTDAKLDTACMRSPARRPEFAVGAPVPAEGAGR